MGMRTLAVIGWIFSNALAAGLIALAYFDDAQVAKVVAEYAGYLTKDGPIPAAAEAAPWLLQQYVLMGAGGLVIFLNMLMLIGAMPRDKADKLPRKGIGVEDKMGETTIEVVALEAYLTAAIRGIDGVEPLEMIVEAPANENKPVLVTVRARVHAAKDVPQKFANDVKKRVRDTLMEVVPLRTQPRIDARVEISGKAAAPAAKADGKTKVL